MKRSTVQLALVFSLLAIPFFGIAQAGSEWDYRLRDRMADIVSDASRSERDVDLSNIEGSEYFVEEFREGKVIMESKNDESPAMLRYNAHRDEFEVKDGDKVQYLVRTANISCELGGFKYLFVNYTPTKKEPRNGYLKILFEAPDFVVYENEEKEFKEGKEATTSLTGSWPAKFADVKAYYFKALDAETATMISKKSTPFLNAATDEHRDIMSKFAKKGKVNFTKSEDVVRYYSHYNSEILGNK